MGGSWNPIRFHFLCFLLFVLCHASRVAWALNDEGLILLEFRERVDVDPTGALENWNSNDSHPCLWMGIQCNSGKVVALNHSGLLMEGILGPEVGDLIHLKTLILYKNHFHGTIPKALGRLRELELLDLRDNEFSGIIPSELGNLQSLKTLLLYGNKFEGNVPPEIWKVWLLSEFQHDASSTSTGVDSVNRKLGHRYKHGKDTLQGCADSDENCSDKLIAQNVEISTSFARRSLLDLSSNLVALPPETAPSPILETPTTLSSGTFQAIQNASDNQSSPVASPPIPSNSAGGPDQPAKSRNSNQSSGGTSHVSWVYYLLIPVAILLAIAIGVLVVMCKKRGVTTIGPWKTGLSGQLQKAFVTGVPKLNRPELETACEDFSNIVETFDHCTVYKGTLSSGVEIAVVSTAVSSLKDWSKVSEVEYRKKIATLSRINHKNFINLLGYCEEEEPFTRMMVFEYAPNGSLFEHLHAKDMESLDWVSRMRIIMGVAYCLKHMYHDLNPPVPLSQLTSQCIYLTDDYAAKIGEICFMDSTPKASGDSGKELSADPETIVYSFGVLLLEMISGKLAYSAELGPIEKWAEQYFRDPRSISYMIDPSIKSLKNSELDVICEVVQECTRPDPRLRPTIGDVTAKLKEVIGITPDQATPRLSPLWWAELEILSVEAT